jgi:SMI1 / KNR4 family (SUKH-1)
MSFEHVYRVTDQLAISSPAEVDELEKQLGLALPVGYREFVTSLGEGHYCDILRVWPPQRIRQELASFRTTYSEHFFWDEESSLLNREEMRQVVPFADTSNADYFVIAPGHPNRIFALPRGGTDISTVDDRQMSLEDLWWQTINSLEEPPEFRYFESWVDRKNISMLGNRDERSADEVIDAFRRQWDAKPFHSFKHDDLHVAHVFIKAIGGHIYLDWHSGSVGRLEITYDADKTQEAASFADKTLVPLGFRHSGRKAAE